MGKRQTRIEELSEFCESHGFTVRTYSPGDGVTRYRFFDLKCVRCGRKVERDDQGRLNVPTQAAPLACRSRPDKGYDIRRGHELNDYFGPDNGDYTALGLKEAWAYARGRGA